MATKTKNAFDFDLTKFADFDVTKFVQDFQVPALDMQALIALQQKNIEAVTAANRAVYEGAQAVSQRQVELLRQAMDESAKTFSELTAAGAPEEKIAQQAELAKKSYASAIANLRELMELAAKSNAEAADVLNARVVEAIDEVKDVVEQTAKAVKK